MFESRANFATVGPHKWHAKSFSRIRKVEDQIQKIEKSNWRPDKLGTTLVHKELCTELSNAEALRHGREVRDIVWTLQTAIVRANEELKHLAGLRGEYERMLYNVEADVRINRESRRMRMARPSGEGIRDGTDDLLAVETQQLREMRRHLDSTLCVIKEHLTTINESRKQLIEVQQERKTVLDLICQKVNNSSDTRVSSRSSSVRKTLSMSTLTLDLERPGSQQPHTDPLSALSPATKTALQMAFNAVSDSVRFRGQVADNLGKLQRYRDRAARLVENSFVNKLGETEQLKNKLHMARVRARSATNKAQRWHDLAEKTLKFNQGPDKYQDLMVRERLDRPVIKVFQRHTGTQLPEAQELIKVGCQLKRSVLSASLDIQQLKTMDAGILDDISSKNRAMEVDRRTLRWRRCKSREMHRR